MWTPGGAHGEAAAASYACTAVHALVGCGSSSLSSMCAQRLWARGDAGAIVDEVGERPAHDWASAQLISRAPAVQSSNAHQGGLASGHVVVSMGNCMPCRKCMGLFRTDSLLVVHASAALLPPSL